MEKLESLWKNVCILDTECTHADPSQAEIVELAVATWNQDWSVRSHLFGCSHMPPAASAVTHIHCDLLKNLSTFDSSVDQVVDMLVSDCKYYVCHNAKYDRHVLQTNLNKIDSDLAELVSDSKKWICTLRLSRHTWPLADSYAQNYLRYWLDLDVCQKLHAHRAGPDTLVCAALFERIVETLLEQGRLNLDKNLEDQLFDLSNQVIPVTNWPFGKHKHVPLEELTTDYLLWCVDNMSMLNEKDPDFDLDLYESVRVTLEKRVSSSS